jgi:hypothetical protein
VRTPSATELGQTPLFGWREKAADRVAGPLSKRTAMREDQVRAVLGALFFVLAAYYVIATLRRAVGAARS